MDEKWTDLGRAYDSIQEKLEKSFSDYEKAVSDSVELVEEMKRKIK